MLLRFMQIGLVSVLACSCAGSRQQQVGVGVAFDTKGAGSVSIRDPQLSASTYVAEDSKEGWVDVVRVILQSYTSSTKRPNEIDCSKIRPRGSVIRTFGGIAPGPDSLIECIKDIDTQQVIQTLNGMLHPE